jgi:hypothetical protein
MEPSPVSRKCPELGKKSRKNEKGDREPSPVSLEVDGKKIIC